MGLDNLNASAQNNNGSEETFVEFCKVEMMSPDHPNGGFEMIQEGSDKEGVMQYKPCQVKEGSKINLRVTMKVYNDTVLGLDFRGTIKYKDMKVVVEED